MKHLKLLMSLLMLTFVSVAFVSCGGEDNSIDEPDLPNEPAGSSETNFMVKTAKFNGQKIDEYYLNLELKSGTISGQTEYYMGLKAQKSSDNENNFTLSPNVKVWDNRSISGESYAYGWLNSEKKSVSPNVGYDKPWDQSIWFPTTTDEISKIYFNFKKYYGNGYTHDFVYGLTKDLSKPVELKSAMAKIVLHFTSMPSVSGNGYFSMYISNYKDENVLPLAGWLDISTGEWIMDNETVLSQVSGALVTYIVIITENPNSTQTFYIPPMEFNDKVLSTSITGYKDRLTFPASKWEAGRTYNYLVTNYSIIAN